MVRIYLVTYGDDSQNIPLSRVFSTDKNLGENPNFVCAFDDPVVANKECPFMISIEDKRNPFKVGFDLNKKSEMKTFLEYHLVVDNITILEVSNHNLQEVFLGE